MKINDKIKGKIQEKGLSFAEFCREIGISKTYLSKLVNNKLDFYALKKSTQYKILNALNMENK